MIRNSSDLDFYLRADALACGRRAGGFSWLSRSEVWRFQRLLRRLEYLENRRPPGTLGRMWRLAARARFRRLSIRLGFTIPPNVFGPGLSIAHRGTIVVSSHARVGSNCRIHVCVNIGVEAGTSGRAPRIGNNVYIGPGAKIFGDIEIADGVAIGANAVVNRSVLVPNISVAGAPARKISDKGSEGLLRKGADLAQRPPRPRFFFTRPRL